MCWARAHVVYAKEGPGVNKDWDLSPRPPEGPPAAKGPGLVPEPMLLSRGLPLTVCNHSSGRCKKIEVLPDLNPDLAGIGVSGFPEIPIWPGSRGRIRRCPGIGEFESLFDGDHDFGVWPL